MFYSSPSDWPLRGTFLFEPLRSASARESYLDVVEVVDAAAVDGVLEQPVDVLPLRRAALARACRCDPIGPS
eukprot:312356-Prorocentrum_minimum.AAC.2